LGAKFYAVEGELMICVVAGRDEHQSYANRMHGGLISALLDETIGRAINIPEPEAFGVTTELTVKFKKPVPLGEEFRVVGKLTRNTRLLFMGEGFIEDAQGTILATASATYVKMTAEKIAGRPMKADEWFCIEDEVKELEVINAGYWND
jgi:uncharacterized protein (TIGR00369 family)